MSKLSKLKFVNNFNKGWKTLFEFYDWLKWSNDNGDAICADYLGFMRLCQDELMRSGLTIDDIPKSTTDDNYVSKWFYLNASIDKITNLQYLDECESYNIFRIRGKVNIRVKA